MMRLGESSRLPQGLGGFSAVALALLSLLSLSVAVPAHAQSRSVTSDRRREPGPERQVRTQDR